MVGINKGKETKQPRGELLPIPRQRQQRLKGEAFKKEAPLGGTETEEENTFFKYSLEGATQKECSAFKVIISRLSQDEPAG